MSQTNEPWDALTDSQWAKIQPIADEFAVELRAGRQPRIADYLSRVGPELKATLKEELDGEEFDHHFIQRYGSWSRYRPIAKLGRGGFGVVYKAWDVKLSRHVALKVLESKDIEVKKRFLDEAGRQANLPKHDHLVQVYDTDELPKGNPFLAMEFVEGGSLREKLDSEGPLAPEVAGWLLEQIAQAVAAVHKATSGTKRSRFPPLVHQDLKPENILLDIDGQAHLADFGLAAAVSDLYDGTACVGGTSAYLSPEQVSAIQTGVVTTAIGPRSDVWSLGVMLFEMLSGKQPFVCNAVNAQIKRNEILEAIRHDDYDPEQLRSLRPDVPIELKNLVGDCLKRNVADRVKSADDVAKRLRAWLDSVSAMPTPLDFSTYLDQASQNFTDRPWLFDQVDAWPQHLNERLLLILGEPGSGKSAFLAELVGRNPRHRVLAWHLCRHKWPESRSAAGFVRSLAGMLAKHIESYSAALASLAVREPLRKENCEEDPASAFEAAIIGPIASAQPPGDGAFFVVVDALDEADLDSKVTIPSLLASWAQRLPAWLRLVASSRHGPVERDMFSGVRKLVIDRVNMDHAADLQEDLRRFLRCRLSQPNMQERLQDAHLSTDTVVQSLLEKSKANFLYLSTALAGVERSLRNAEGSIYTFAHLHELPPGLHSLYDADFRRHWPDRPHFASIRPILEVLIAAKRALRENLLAFATGLNDYELDTRLDELSDYVDRRYDAVQVRHPAISEWLTETKSMHRIIPKEGHIRLANACCNEYNRRSMSGYAIEFLPHHLAESKRADDLDLLNRDRVFQLIRLRWQFLQDKSLLSAFNDHFSSSDLASLLEDFYASNPEAEFVLPPGLTEAEIAYIQGDPEVLNSHAEWQKRNMPPFFREFLLADLQARLVDMGATDRPARKREDQEFWGRAFRPIEPRNRPENIDDSQ